MLALLIIMENNVINKNFVIGSRNEKNISIINEICDICNKHLKLKYDCKSLVNFISDRLGHDYRYAINPEFIEKSLKWS